jgi:hypothetical protein
LIDRQRPHCLQASLVHTLGGAGEQVDDRLQIEIDAQRVDMVKSGRLLLSLFEILVIIIIGL